MCSEINGLNIRHMERNDCESIASLIRELAIYEKMEDRVQRSAKDLERDAFDTNPPSFRCLVAELPCNTVDNENRKTLIGYIIYFYTYNTWEGKAIHLEDLYITQKFRQAGVGSQLLKKLARISVDGGFSRITFECLDWNVTAQNFYKKFGAVNITEDANGGYHFFRFLKERLGDMLAV